MTFTAPEPIVKQAPEKPGASASRSLEGIIAVCALAAIALHLLLRFGLRPAGLAFGLTMFRTLAGIDLANADLAGAVIQEIIDVIAVANALRTAIPPRALSDYG